MNERIAKGLSWPEITVHLLLARLLVPSRKPLTPSRWKRDVELFFRHAASPAQWSELFEAGRKHCLDEGLVRDKPLALTAAGREACLAFWQIDPTKLPARLTWQIVLRAVIAPQALGVPRETFQTKEPAKALMLAVLRKGLRLPATVRTRTDLLNALAWRELGIESTAAFTSAAVVAQRLLRTDRPLQADEVVKNLAKTELIPSEKDLFRAAVQKWIADAAADAADCATPSTADATVNSTANSRRWVGFAGGARSILRRRARGRSAERYGPVRRPQDLHFPRLAAAPRTAPVRRLVAAKIQGAAGGGSSPSAPVAQSRRSGGADGSARRGGVGDRLPGCSISLYSTVRNEMATSSAAPHATAAAAPVDPRLEAFRSPQALEVFHSVCQKDQIWRFDPLDVHDIHEDSRLAFYNLIEGKLAASGHILLLKGEAGSGKTHLMRAFRNQTHEDRRGFCGYMQMTTATESYGRYILANLIDSLGDPYQEQYGDRSGLLTLSNLIVEARRRPLRGRTRPTAERRV